MDEKEIEELAKEMAEVHGISLDSATSMIVFTVRMVSDVSKAIIEIVKLLSDSVGTLWEEIQDCIERLESEYFICERQVWLMDWDTRKKSQVISNKPRFMVRKIIG